MNAICAPPSSATAVAWSCASAIRSPSALSESRVVLRVIAAVTFPTGLLAIGADRPSHLAIVAVCVASGVTSRVTAWFTLVTDARTTSFVLVLSFSSVSVITRPNDEALVTHRGLPAGSSITHVYGWCVWPVTTMSIFGDRPCAIWTIGPDRPAAPSVQL